jgi:hypothetical protein
MPPLKRHPNEPLIRFRRELNGTKYKFKPPQPPMLPRHRIDDLEPTLNIRLYTVIRLTRLYLAYR